MIKLITGKSSKGVRTADFLGREHLVVPVVALAEGVLFPMGAQGPELVLAEEFSKAPQGWNGRPVMLDHPVVAEERVSANEPMVLERWNLGHLFHTRVEGKKLLTEAWIDLQRVAEVEGASDLVEKIRRGELVEVSVGVFVAEESKSGTFKGERFTSIWRDIVPDHLAVLSEGTIGACSVDMGCGAPRAAQKEEEADVVQQSNHQPTQAPPARKSVRARLAEFISQFKPSQSEDMSDTELRSALDGALRAIVPGFLGVDSIFPSESTVVYAVAPGDSLQLFRRSYTLSTEGVVTLGDDAQEVKQVIRFEPVNPVTTAAHGCGCSGKQAETKPASGVVMAEITKEKKDRVAAVVARLAKKSKLFTASDAALMEQWPDDRIKALEDELEKEDQQPTQQPTQQPPPPAAPPEPPAPLVPIQTERKPKTEIEFLAEAPESIRVIVEEHKARAAARKEDLVKALKSAQSAYSEEELNGMQVVDLEKLSKVAGVAGKQKVDFVGQAPRAAGSGGSDSAPPKPIDMNERIRAARAGGKKAS